MVQQPFDLWGQRGWAGQDVAGESSYYDAIRRLLGTVSEDWTEVQAQAQLLPEPTNAYDRNAVQVLIHGSLVGYLPREDAVRYAPVLSSLISQGWIPQVRSTVRGAIEYDFDVEPVDVVGKTFIGSVRLDLAEPHLLVPVNPPPSVRHVVLPVGRAIQVTGEEAYLSLLSALVGQAQESWIYVTLHEVTEQLARSSRTVAEVRVDGSVAGKLTPKMSGELLPAIRHFTARDVTTSCRAIVKGNQLKADVVLYVARAGELSAEWLANALAADGPDRIADAGVADVAPSVTATGWRFNPPPGWPAPPPGWLPPAGWTVPPGLPPAPAGWQWWIPARPPSAQPRLPRVRG